MATLIILLVCGVLLQVLCRIFSAYLNFKVVVAFKIIAYALVIFSAVILVFFNPQVFKEFQGYVCACMVALFLPWIIDNFLGMVFGSPCKKIIMR